MKICKVCNEIVGSNQACSREGCPALANSDVGSLPALEAGFSGVADSAFQASLDHVGYVARNASRRIALFAVLTSTALLIAAFIGYNLFVRTDSDEEITVEISGRANVRNAPTAEGSSVLETLSPGVELAGRWVDGASDPAERWFEFERNGENAYVWEGNLIVAGGFGNTQRVKKATTKPECSATLWDGREVKGPCNINYEGGGNFSVIPLGVLAKELWTAELYFEPSEARISLAPPCSPGCTGSATRVRRDPSNSQCWINLSNPTDYVLDNFQRFCILG